MGKPSRREFLKGVVATGAAAAGLPAILKRTALGYDEEKKKKKEDKKKQDKEKGAKDKLANSVAVAKNDNPAKAVKRTIDLLGGIKKFVKKGDVVVVKPNIAWDRKPEQAACTNPQVVAAIVKLCKEAGAKIIKVFDRPCNNAKRCYINSGIKAAAQKQGAKVTYVDSAGRNGFEKTKFANAKALFEWPMFKEALDADVLINVPIAKHHGTTKLTLCMKNLMGICGGNRGQIHRSIDEKLADIATLVKPHLNIVDAYRILWASGPAGGRTRFVKKTKTIIAGTNMVTVDAYATQLFKGLGRFGNIKPRDIGHIKIAGDRKLGEIDLKKIKVLK